MKLDLSDLRSTQLNPIYVFVDFQNNLAKSKVPVLLSGNIHPKYLLKSFPLASEWPSACIYMLSNPFLVLLKKVKNRTFPDQCCFKVTKPKFWIKSIIFQKKVRKTSRHHFVVKKLFFEHKRLREALWKKGEKFSVRSEMRRRWIWLKRNGVCTDHDNT